jgi:hypothetical protein
VLEWLGATQGVRGCIESDATTRNKKPTGRYAVRLFLRLPVSNPSSAAKIKSCAGPMFPQPQKSPVQSGGIGQGLQGAAP